MKDDINKEQTHVFRQFGKDIASVLGGTAFSYFIVQFVSLSIIEKKLYYFFDQKLLIHLFSYQMIPPFIAFAILITSIYYFYQKTKTTMALLNKKEIEHEREKAAIEATQTISAMMISYIARYNADIQDWLTKKKHRGNQLPEQIINASDKIAQGLKTMSELSYLLPYTNPDSMKLETYTADLESRLKMISSGELPAVGGA